jgi:hypothetical protein
LAFDFTFKAIDHYVRSPNYKLFKLHGSINWGNLVVEDARVDVHQDVERVRETLIDLSDSIQYENDQFVVLDEPRVVVKEWLYLPAISIPVQTKSHFSCPQDWLPRLENLLDGVTNLLIIGWRGGEDHFLERMVPVLNKNADLQLSIVSPTGPSASETQSRLQGAGLRTAHNWVYTGGFTNFILTDAVTSFLRRAGNAV